MQGKSVRRSKRRMSRGRQQRGGEVLGEGGYGCVIRPNIACPNTVASKNLVSKLVDEKRHDVENEIIDDLHVTEIKDYDKYFATTKDSCVVDTRTPIPAESQSDFMHCTRKSPYNKHVNYIQTFGGIDLVNYRRAHPHQTVRDMIPYYAQLFDILRVLQAHDIVHRDIKPANIVINEEEGRLRLIDFGISHHINEKNNIDRPWLYANDYESVYQTGYYIWPIEINLFTYVPIQVGNSVIARLGDKLRPFTTNYINTQFEHIKKYLLRNYPSKMTPIYPNVYLDSCHKMQRHYNDIMKNTSERVRQNKIMEWKNMANQRLDLYSIGCVIMDDILDIIKNTGVEPEDIGLLDEMTDLLFKRVLQQDSRDRPTVTQASDAFLDICKRHGVSLCVEKKNTPDMDTMSDVTPHTKTAQMSPEPAQNMFRDAKYHSAQKGSIKKKASLRRDRPVSASTGATVYQKYMDEENYQTPQKSQKTKSRVAPRRPSIHRTKKI